MSILSHRIALDPTEGQRQFLARSAGVARFAWNWALEEWNRQRAANKKPTAGALKKQWNAIKRKQFPWVYDSPKDANQRPFMDLHNAFRRYFNGLAARPRFKRRGEHDSFYLCNDQIALNDKRIRIPKVGWVRMREALRFTGKIMSVTVSRTAGRWFASIAVDLGDDYARPRTDNKVLGVDLGITHTATLSDGRVFDAPKPLKRLLVKLRRLNKALARKQKGSNRRERAKAKLARLYARIANMRSDFLHKLTTLICRESQAVVIEDLNVKGLLRNRCLSRAIVDVGFYEFRRQLAYKAELHGTRLVVAGRWFPSSKTCSACGHKKEKLSLGEREFACEDCGAVCDRDLNAARNLKQLAAGLAVTARGEDVRPKASGPDADLCEARTSEALPLCGTCPR